MIDGGTDVRVAPLGGEGEESGGEKCVAPQQEDDQQQANDEGDGRAGWEAKELVGPP